MSMPGASGFPKPRFLTRKLVIEDDDMTPEDNSCGSLQEVVATAARTLWTALTRTAPPPRPLSQRRQPPLPPLLPPAKRAGEVAASLRRALYRLN